MKKLPLTENHISDKRLRARIYKELPQLNNEEDQNALLKNGQSARMGL